MFQFRGLATFVFQTSSGWVAPFGHLRINASLQLPVDFRSLPRPSSPPGAKASPARSYPLPILGSHAICEHLYLTQLPYFLLLLSSFLSQHVNELFMSIILLLGLIEILCGCFGAAKVTCALSFYQTFFSFFLIFYLMVQKSTFLGVFVGKSSQIALSKTRFTGSKIL